MSIFAQPQLDYSKVLKNSAKSNKQKKEEDLKKEFKSPSLVKSLLGESNTALQLLVFHYLGVLDQLSVDNKKKAIFLSLMFKTEGIENIRKKLSNVGGANSTLKSRKNLEATSELFEYVGLTKEREKVKADLKKLQQKGK